jgi:hypothetical protein
MLLAILDIYGVYGDSIKNFTYISNEKLMLSRYPTSCGRGRLA